MNAYAVQKQLRRDVLSPDPGAPYLDLDLYLYLSLSVPVPDLHLYLYLDLYLLLPTINVNQVGVSVVARACWWEGCTHTPAYLLHHPLLEF